MIKVRHILITLSVLLVCTYFVWSLYFLPPVPKSVACNNIDIVIKDSAALRFVSEKALIELLQQKKQFRVGSKLSEIKTCEIEDVLINHTMLKTVECYKTPTNSIVIEIMQRVPKFRIAGKQNYYVDTNRKLVPITTKHAIYVPVVTGQVSPQMAISDLYDFIDYIENDSFFESFFTQIHVSTNEKIVLTPRIGDYDILLGKLDKNYKTRLGKLKKLYVDGFSEIGFPKYSTIDLQYKNQVICKK